MSTNEPLTEINGPMQCTPTSESTPRAGSGGKGSADYVFSVFRQDITPFRKMIWTAVVMQLLLIPIVCVIPSPWKGTARIVFGPEAEAFADALERWSIIGLASPISLIAILAIPYVPGIILRRHFRDAVIPMCRNTCSGNEIARGAMQSLRYMLVRYVLVLLPGILVYLVPVVITLVILIKTFCDAQGGELVIIHGSFSVIVWMYLLSLPGWLLSEYALTVFPVARLFSRRIGVFLLMLTLIYLARIVFVLNPVVTAERTVILTVAVILICTALSVGAIAYFNYAAKTDAEKWKLMDRE